MGNFRKLFGSCVGDKSESTGRSKKYKSIIKVHVKCRSTDAGAEKVYEKDKLNEIKRPYVPEENVPWTVEWPEYTPLAYTNEKIIAPNPPVWADPADVKTIKDWNQLDAKKIDRRSHMGEYDIDKNGYPVNPMGRTGICQRGVLGKWGPNHAADPIVTRWKRDNKGKIIKDALSKKPILQFVAIERADTGEWAIPGGMCDPGENVSVTLLREFMEEATNSLEKTKEEKQKIEKELKELFKKIGKEVYKGYVDDPRNTDNSWMETIAYNFHDENGKSLEGKLEAGDDAKKVKWMDIDSNIKLYASHREFIEKVVKKHKAHW